MNYLISDEPLRFTKAEMDRLLVYSYQLAASDITIQTQEPIVAEIYGRLHQLTKRRLATAEIGEMLNAIYGANGMTQILSGKDLDTHYEIRPSRAELYRYRVNATGCQVEDHDGLQLTLRTIPTDPPLLSSLEIEPDLMKALAPEDGVVYVTGATGSGKSTLLASIVRYIVEQEDAHRKVLTYESPIEFVFDRIKKPTAIVSQSEIPRHLPDFASGVRNALRRKPRLILVGESRDRETIAAVMEAAITGHPVYTTLHSNGVAEVLRRLVNTFSIEERQGRLVDLIETIRLIIWQKLVPTLDGRRTALREYLVFDESIRDRLLQAEPHKITQLTRELLKTHGQSMQAVAKRKYEEGIISERTYQLLLTTAQYTT